MVVRASMLLISLLFAASFTASAAPRDPAQMPSAPLFNEPRASHWINSPPLEMTDLRGRVTLIDFWTFDCWNCYRSLPWLNTVAAVHRDRGLTVVGVHTPEFAHEKVLQNVRDKVTEFEVIYPVVVDNDMRVWNAYGNRYWPAFYVIDKQGRVRGFFAGETHAGDAQAQKIEKLIAQLLEET